MRFGQLDGEIQKCEQHLDETGKRNTQIESYIVGYLLVRICSEYETRIATLIQRRCSRINDPHVLKFAHLATKSVTKRFNIGDINAMLDKFGEDYKKAFTDAVNDKVCHVAWDNIYANRNTVAHGNTAVLMNMNDLKRDYNASLVVIDELVKALCLRPKDIKGLK